ncbi:MAG: outer membrane beta-barrel protein [Betaproteobacteria bacterium]
MFKKTIIAGLAASVLMLPAAVLAQAPTGDKPAESGPITIGGFELTGYVDVGYTYLSGRGAFNTTPAGPGVTVGGPNRVFDFDRNSLNLHQAAITLAKQPKEGFGGLLNVIAGKDPDVFAAYKTDPSNGGLCNLATGLNTATPGSCKKDHWDITQAFVQYAAGSFTIIGGKYVTLAGAEVIDSRAGPNYSRSILFGYAIPFTHTGARVSYAATDTLTLMGGVNNGWDDLKDTNGSKTLELGMLFSPTKTFTLGAQGYSGKERVGGLINTGPEGTRNLIDLVATFAATDKLTFILNYDYATQDNTATVTPNGVSKSKWQGWAGYANYQINERWRTSLRAEYFDDRDGYRTGLIQKWKEATLTLGWMTPVKNLELQAEIRGDLSNVPAFIDSNSITASKSQNSFGLRALYKF